MENMGDFGYVVRTAKSVDGAVSSLDEELKRRKFSILWDLDMKAKLEEKGIAGGPTFRVLEICSAPRAKEALDADLHVGYFLPCKIVVYREQDQTHIGLLRPTVLINFFNNPKLATLGEEVEGVLVDAIKAAM